MNNKPRQPVVLYIFIVSASVSSCAMLPAGQVFESATVVYTAGSRKHTAAVQLPVAASTVFMTLIDIVDDRPNVIVENRNDKALLIEVTQGSRILTGQVTKLGDNRSLMYVWADAGESGLSGEELATTVVQIVCDELGVNYELVHY